MTSFALGHRGRRGLALAACCWTLLALAFSLAHAAAAGASSTEPTMLIDDKQFVYTTTAAVDRHLEFVKALGVDYVKISVVWSLVAPHPNWRHRPKFNATNPDAYPSAGWTRYDRIVKFAKQIGLGVVLQVDPPAPRWATAAKPRKAPGHSWSRLPNARDYGQFVQAVGKRYSGSFVPPGSSPPPTTTTTTTSTLPVPVTVPSSRSKTAASAADTSGSDGALPAVRWWNLWNEPNDPGWLSPQYRRVGRQAIAYGPLLYRRLLDAGYAGLRATGHAHDRILIGEITSFGNTRPVAFVRDLYCVGIHFRPLGGSAARELGCPTSGGIAGFRRAHPGLFRAAGWSFHPYSLLAPNAPARDGTVTLQNLGTLEHTLGLVRHTYGVGGSLPIYITEWGYKTKPPNPYAWATTAEQAVYLNEGEYMSWRLPYVRSFAQLELRDAAPNGDFPRGSEGYWDTFQTGLMFLNGRRKPAFYSFRLPIWVPSPRDGSSVAVWGQLRPADHGQVQRALLQFQPRGRRSKWRRLASVSTTNREGFLFVHVAIRRVGKLRLVWHDPSTGATDYSRSVSIER